MPHSVGFKQVGWNLKKGYQFSGISRKGIKFLMVVRRMLKRKRNEAPNF